MNNKRAMSNKIIILLVVLAVVLAFFSISYNLSDSKSSSEGSGATTSSAGGRVGIEIIPQGVEDRGLDGYGG